MSKTLSAKRKTTKKACERYQNLSKEEKDKKGNVVVNVTKISQKMKNKNLLSIEKKYYRMRKSIKKIFQFRKFSFLIKKSIRNF